MNEKHTSESRMTLEECSCLLKNHQVTLLSPLFYKLPLDFLSAVSPITAFVFAHGNLLTHGGSTGVRYVLQPVPVCDMRHTYKTCAYCSFSFINYHIHLQPALYILSISISSSIFSECKEYCDLA